MKIFFIICLLLGIATFLYLAYLYMMARLEVKAAPREEMFTCDKHGVFRKKHLITFMGDEWCPRCLDERIKVPLDSSVDWKQ